MLSQSKNTRAVGAFAERRWKSHDDLLLFARDYAGADGSAKLPVVCLHGLTRNSSDFEDLAPRIAQSGRRVIVPDVRGRGLSSWDPSPNNYIPKVYARDVVGLLDALGIARAVFLGTSMGGIIMMMLAACSRKRISAAVLNDVGPEVAPEGFARIQAYAGRSVEFGSWSAAVDHVRLTHGHALPHLSDEQWEHFTERTFAQTDEGALARYDPAIAGPIQGGKAKAHSLIAWILYRRLAKGRPTLIVRGAQSDILSRQTALKMTAVAPRTRLIEVPDVGHAPTLDELVSREALAEFLKQVE